MLAIIHQAMIISLGPQSSWQRCLRFRYLSCSAARRSSFIRSADKPSRASLTKTPKTLPDNPKNDPTSSDTTPTNQESQAPVVPEKKKTFAQNFVTYWINLASDYKVVYFEAIEEAKEKPKNTMFYLVCLGIFGYLLQSNPSERDFKETLINYRLELDLVGIPIRSSKSEKHIRELDKLFNGGQVRYQSCAFFSIVWKHDADKRLGIFDSQCSYLRPLFSEFRERIVDIGCVNKWWISSELMKDFDINEKEWEEKKEIPLILKSQI